jgi:hypothetical protein
MSAKREGMARSWEVATRELPNFWERTQGKSWAEKVGQNKKLGRGIGNSYVQQGFHFLHAISGSGGEFPIRLKCRSCLKYRDGLRDGCETPVRPARSEGGI